MPWYNVDGTYVEAETPEAAQRKVWQSEPPKVQVPLDVQLYTKALEAFPEADYSKLETPGAWTSMKEGFMQDDPREQRAFYEKQYPNGVFKDIEVGGQPYLTIYNPDTNGLIFPNVPGLGSEDWGLMAGRAALPVAATAGTAMIGPGALPLVMAGAGSELAREGAQTIYGTQREDLPEFVTRAAISGMAELPGALLSGATTSVANTLGGRGSLSVGARRNVQAGAAAEASGALPPIQWYRPQLSADPVVSRFWKQQAQLGPRVQTALANQQDEVLQAARQSVPAGPDYPEDIIGRSASDYYAGQGFVTPPNASEGGKTLLGVVERGQANLKARMSREYVQEEKIAALENPQFDMTPVANSIRTQPVMADVLDESGDVVQRNISGPVPEAIRKLTDDIEALATKPQGYAEVQEMTKRVNSLLDMNPVALSESGVNIGQLKLLKKALVDVKMNPVTPAPQFTSVARRAETAAKKFHDTYHVDAVKTLLNAKDAKQLNSAYIALADNPNLLEEGALAVIRKAGPKAQEDARLAIFNRVLSKDDPLAALRRLEVEGGDGYAWLMKDPGVADAVRTSAKFQKQMNNTQFRQAWERDTFNRDFTRKLLDEQASQPRDTARLMSRTAKPGSPEHTAYRRAVYEDVLDKAIRENAKTSSPGVDPKILGEQIAHLKDTGRWEHILTPLDREKLSGLLDYSQRSWQEGGGGNELVIAHTVRKLFSLQGHEALAEIGLSRWMADAMLSPRFNKNLLSKAAWKSRTAGPVFSGRVLRTATTIADDLLGNYPFEEVKKDLQGPAPGQ